MLIAGEPGVGKTRLAGEWSRQAYDQGALVIYGRCDEDLGAPYQPFAEALRSLVPCLGAKGLRALRGVEALLTLIPSLNDVLPDLAAPTRADPDTERYALFDAVVALLGTASASAPVVLILDDLHWAAKPTLLLLRHLLRFGEHARVQIVGTYRSTDLDRSHPLAAMLADLHRDGTAYRMQLSGLDEDDVTTYVAEAGYDDAELARALASVTGGNPFFLIEALRHVEESGGHWDPSTLPQGVREAVTRRLSRLTPETNKALGAAAVVGSRFGLALVEQVVGHDLVDAFDEARTAGIVIEEPGGNYRFNHALVRQSLLAELASVRRMRLHQRIATSLETQRGADDELLAELAYHYFECAWAGNAAKAVDYCRRAADQAMTRLGYEGAADLYDRALHALEEIDDELPDRDDQAAELMIARCEALLAAGDVATAGHAVAQLQRATADSARLAAWARCFDGELAMLTHPERLDEIEAALSVAAGKLAELHDAAGEAKAHTVRAGCLARLGRVGDCEIALDDALTAARRAGEHRRVNAVLAGAPLAALWGPNPVPRAGGRCLDVIRLLRITADSPAVEATSTRCQAVLEAFRGRAAAARRMIDSARRTVTELGLRHAFSEVEQFAGIVELVVDDPAAAEPHLRQAYNGFRRMGLDADTAETAALLGRACLALDRAAEAGELCAESERLAGHALKPSIAWRTLRAKLWSRAGDHDEARRVAEAAVALAERTDALVDHGDACLALATVLGAAGDASGARVAAGQAMALYDRKGAAALAEKAQRILGERELRPALAPAEPQIIELDNACARMIRRGAAAIDREAWDEFERLHAPEVFLESRRKITGGFIREDFSPSEARRVAENGGLRPRIAVIAVRGERLALTQMVLGSADMSPGAPVDEILQLFGIDDDGRFALQVSFDMDDLEAAIAELDATHARSEEEGHRQSRKLANAASQMGRRFLAHLAAGNQDALAEMLADNFAVDDRRRLVGAAVLDGREAGIASMRAIAEVFGTSATPTDIATRGENLLLGRISLSENNKGPQAFLTEMLTVNEINDDGQLVAIVVFDLDDFSAAIAELDRRYLAGEAAAHPHTWSIVARSYAALSTHEPPSTTPNCINIDHRGETAFGPGDLNEYLSVGMDSDQDINLYVEAAHRLTDLGAVITYAAHETSRDGFVAEWRGIALFTVDAGMVNRIEVFNESDLEVALTEFDQLNRSAARLENAASRVAEDFSAYYVAGDWQAMADLLVEDYVSDDRRQVVSSGVRRGRDAHLADMEARSTLWRKRTLTIVATRGERLALARIGLSNPRQGPETFLTEVLVVNEINADGQLAAGVAYDVEAFDAAIAELDARYLAGEGSTHAHTWSVVSGGYDGFNRRQLLETTPEWVNIDHRRGAAFADGDMIAYIQKAWDDSPDTKIYIAAVHRLGKIGAVVTHVAHGISQQSFDAEWRDVHLLTVEGELFSCSELFDEEDLDAAVAKFDELSRPAPRPENRASRVTKQLGACFSAHDWHAVAELLADNFFLDDRQRVVGAGVRHGRDAEIDDLRAAVSAGIRHGRGAQLDDMRAIADMGMTDFATNVEAIRGDRLALMRTRMSYRALKPDGYFVDVLAVMEINAEQRIAAVVSFDMNSLDAAIDELDRRYVAGEAAPHAQVWRAGMNAIEELNKHKQGPLIGRFAYADHRRVPFASGAEFGRGVEELWSLVPDARYRVTAAHALEAHGSVVTLVIEGTDRHGGELQWARIVLFTADEPRVEVYEEDDLEAALARFKDLRPPPRQLDNTAIRVSERLFAALAGAEWDSVKETLADNFAQDDRRRLVGAGVRHGRDEEVADLRAIAELWRGNTTRTYLATRGERLDLMRLRFSLPDQGDEAFVTEVLGVGEINADGRVVAAISFDPDDIDAAFAELDVRYLAGEAAAHADIWTLVTRAYSALNKRQLPETTEDWVNIDHRRLAPIAAGDLGAYLFATWDLSRQSAIRIESVHRLSKVGAVVTQVIEGASQQGFDAEWRTIDLSTYKDNRIDRCELFDEADLDAALARFEELNRP